MEQVAWLYKLYSYTYTYTTTPTPHATALRPQEVLSFFRAPAVPPLESTTSTFGSCAIRDGHALESTTSTFGAKKTKLLIPGRSAVIAGTVPTVETTLKTRPDPSLLQLSCK